MEPKVDASLDFLATLNDASKWVIRRGVPIFKPHKRTNPLTNEVMYEVTAADLPTIAGNMTALEAVGVFGRITPGHVLPTNTEEKQPSLYGWERNPRVGTFGPKNEPCILVDEYLYPETADKAGKLPFRSAEYYHQQKVIRGVAKLIRDPYLDLGVVTYASEHGAFFSYEANEPMDPTKTGTEPTPEEIAQADALMQKYKAWMCQKYNLVEKPADPNAVPGGGAIPEAIRLQLSQQATLYQTQTVALASVVTELKALKKKSTESEIDSVLTQLSAVEHYQFDAKAEKATMLEMEEPQRVAHVARIRANYKKDEVPPSSGFNIPVHLEGAGGGSSDLELTNQAILYVRDHPGSDFLKVLAELDAKANPKK